MELMKGVHRIEAYAACVLLVDDRAVLVDTSSDKAAKAILAYLPKAGLEPKDLASIIVTHCHPDHSSGLAAVKEKAPGARVAAHGDDADAVAGKPYRGPPIRGPVPWRGVPVDDRLRDGQRYEGLLVIHTPGHTPGSIALLDEDRSLLVAGDSFNTDATHGPLQGPGVGTMDDAYNIDPRQHRESVKKLAKYEFEACIVGHGEPVLEGAGRKVRELAQRL